jgi:polyribonucleotide nucleotidyltransferase
MWNAVRNQSPYYELQDYYEKRHGIRKGSVLVDAVPVGRGERGRVLWWTATFTCPVTGAVTEAGVARNQAQFVVEDPEGGPSSPRVVYEKKRHAVQAAAARALDVIQYRATGLTEPRFCEEDPSKDAAAAALPAGFASGQSPREEGQQKVAEDHVTVHGISPLRELHTYYQQRHGISKDDLTIDATKVLTSEGSKICWTATFRCPVTQMKYPAGTMRNVTRVTVEEEEGAADVSRILYWKKGHAIHAAAARALDAIRYRDTGQTEPRFCEEDPSKDATTVARPQVVSAPVDDILPGERQPKVVEEEAVEPPVTAPLSKLHDHEENVEGSQNVEWRIKEGPSFQLGMGGVAQHADCSVTGTSGDTVVVTTVCTEETDGNPFLTVDYRHLSASAGLIPAGVRRKDAWQNPANVTAARAVDRALRPLYAGKGHAHVDCTVHATGRGHPVALAINAAAASVPLKEPVAAVALAVTEDGTVIPNEWNTGETDDVLGELLLACTRSGKVVMLEWTGNSLVEQEWASLLSLAVASVQAALETVLEGASLWAPEQEDLTATLREQLGLPESAQESVVEEKDLVAELQSLAVDYCRERLQLPTQRLFGMDPENSGTRRDFSVDTASIYTGAPLLSKRVRGMREQIMQQEVAAVVNEFLNQQNTPNDTSLLSEEEKARLCELTADELFRQALWQSAHLSGARADGRPFPDGWKTVRPVQVGVPALPESVHGSALFKRGETRVLCTVTLGSPREGLPRVDPQNRIRGLSPKQEKDSSSGYESLPVGSLRFLRTQEALESDFNSRKSRADRERTGDSGTLAEVQRAFLQYDFPAYSTGEVPTGSRQKQRRSIGHGALAERAIKAVLPDPHDFPYSIRMTSEVTDSNGSSSMASVCGTCLALLDAGVPLKEPVAGVSVGLAVNKDADDHDEDRYSLLLDITGTEDHVSF